MKKLIIASNNEHKVREIKEILGDKIEVRSLKDEKIDIDVIEDGKTFIENSRKKAKEIVSFLKNLGKKDFVVMADDSGLVVDYLNGEPGIYSARYAGEHGNSKRNNEKLLNKLKNIPMKERSAAFVCAVVLISSDGEESIVEGHVKGYITEEEKGYDGFGYDPLFYAKEFDKTFAEMTNEEKNSISHRGKALGRVKVELEKML